MHTLGLVLVWSGLSSTLVSLIAHEAGFRSGHRAGSHETFVQFYGERIRPESEEDRDG